MTAFFCFFSFQKKRKIISLLNHPDTDDTFDFFDVFDNFFVEVAIDVDDAVGIFALAGIDKMLNIDVSAADGCGNLVDHLLDIEMHQRDTAGFRSGNVALREIDAVGDVSVL